MRFFSGVIKRQAGFSLIEMVAVIVVMGIMVVGVTSFINDSAVSYAKAASRNQLASAGRMVLDRISMELHNALPLSVRTSTPLDAGDKDNGYGYIKDQCLEFLPIKSATTYLNPVFRPAAVSAAEFDVVKLLPTQDGLSGRYAVIYPTKSTDLYKDSFSSTEVIVPVTVASIDAGKDGLTPAAAHRFKRRSPEDRLFITTQPVSFCVVGNRLYRYSDYGFYDTQLIPKGPGGACIAATCLPDTTPKRVLITDLIDNTLLSGTAFDFLDTTRRRNGVIQMEFVFSLQGESIRLNHEVLQQASP